MWVIIINKYSYDNIIKINTNNLYEYWVANFLLITNNYKLFVSF